MKTIHFGAFFEIVSWISILLGIISFIIILIDIRFRPQKMKVMNWVWTLNALWGSILILWAYFAFGRQNSAKAEKNEQDAMKDMDMSNVKGMNMNSQKPFWQKIVSGTLHCGAGCSLADIIGTLIFFFLPFTLFNNSTAGEWILDYGIALLIGVTFQYAALAPMAQGEKNTRFKLSIWLRALQIDFLSLSAWQIGMYGWMAIVIFGMYGRIPPSQIEFWFMMQIAMIAGFLSAYPVNLLLIKKGIKKAM